MATNDLMNLLSRFQGQDRPRGQELWDQYFVGSSPEGGGEFPLLGDSNIVKELTSFAVPRPPRTPGRPGTPSTPDRSSGGAVLRTGSGLDSATQEALSQLLQEMSRQSRLDTLRQRFMFERAQKKYDESLPMEQYLTDLFGGDILGVDFTPAQTDLTGIFDALNAVGGEIRPRTPAEERRSRTFSQDQRKPDDDVSAPPDPTIIDPVGIFPPDSLSTQSHRGGGRRGGDDVSTGQPVREPTNITDPRIEYDDLRIGLPHPGEPRSIDDRRLNPLSQFPGNPPTIPGSYRLRQNAFDPGGDARSWGLLAPAARRVQGDLSGNLRALREALPMGGGEYARSAGEAINRSFGDIAGLKAGQVSDALAYLQNLTKENKFGIPVGEASGAGSSMLNWFGGESDSRRRHDLGLRGIESENTNARLARMQSMFGGLFSMLGSFAAQPKPGG